ncbi:hypothetical protein [Streptomyces sp. NPDC052225]|uniref:hypothetical protein n=1 Tax=Streptomyces sp. NPDC052225 TaxID=3154949 RepID=UPI00342B5266
MLGDLLTAPVEWVLDRTAGRAVTSFVLRRRARADARDLARAEAGLPASLPCAVRGPAGAGGADRVLGHGWLRVNDGEPRWWGEMGRGELALARGDFRCVERRAAPGLPGSVSLLLRGPGGDVTELVVAEGAAPVVLRLLTEPPGASVER